MIRHYDWSPVQGSMTQKVGNYKSYSITTPKLGVIMEVRHADHPRNRASMEHDDRRGWMPEATVWLVADGAVLRHVLIPNQSPSGLDNFEEQLPRASKLTVKGDAFDENISQVDPHDLDGDWCIVQFLDGSIQNPYIANWWPNPRNIYDCATSGHGNPQFTTSKGTSLDQSNRYFKRTNGVEYVVTRQGDIWISTSRAGSRLAPGQVSSDGRFPRSTFGEGGSILLNIKSSETLEVSFDNQVDGIGPGQYANDSLPQANPAPVTPAAKALVQTFIKGTKDNIDIKVPIRFTVRSKQAVLIEAPDIYLGENAEDMAALSSPTMSNFNTLKDKINEIINTLNAGLPVTPVPPAGLIAKPVAPVVIVPLVDEVACDKVHIE